MPDHPDIEEALGAIGERDHSITAEYRIFGPPGTGKTTNLTRQIRRAVNRFGKDSVLVTSFSRAAAAELAGQDLPVSPDRVGTLHSHCWHALGRPEIAEVHVEEWNRENPHLRITSRKEGRKLDGEESDEDLLDDRARRRLLAGRVESVSGNDAAHGNFGRPRFENSPPSGTATRPRGG